MNAFLQRVQHLDTITFLWLQITNGIRYRKLVRFISATGDGPVYLLIGLSLFFFEPSQGNVFFWTGVSAYCINVSLYLILKNTIKRDRPAMKINCYEAAITPSDKFSFPSGHTAAAFLFACLIAHFYPTFSAPAFLWATLVGTSRVLLGVHYPTDIFAGASLGSSCAFLIFNIHSL